jgi:gliding-associated putative ABC transporter substrate-binding component GldG
VRAPTDKKRLSIYGLTTTGLVVGIVVLANIVSANLFGRADLTAGNIYSLSNASKKIVADLDDDFLVKAYFSRSLPPPYNASAKYVEDQLQEYRAYGKGRFKFTFVDPGDDTKLEEEAQKYRIPPVQVQVVEQDQFQAKKVYMGLVCLYKDRQEVLPVVDNPSGLEYEVTAAIKKLASGRTELPAVGFLAGHGEPSMEQLQTIQQVFSKLYRMRAVSLANGARVPDDVQVLVVASPRQNPSAWEQYAIDQHIMRGGKVAFLLDKVDVNLQYQQAFPLTLAIDDWTRAYGFRVADNLIGDFENPGILTVSQQEGMFRMMSQVPFPFIPSLRDFDRTNVMVKDLQRMSPYFASSIDTTAAAGKGLAVEPLIRTSPKTMLQERQFSIDPLQRWTPEQFDKGQQIVAAVISGTFTSAFAGQPVPSASDSAVAAPPDLAQRLDKSVETRILVLGDGEFFVDGKGGGDRDNLLFFQNMIDWLAQDEALISIRSRESTDRPLRAVSDQTKRAVKYANMVGGPLAIVLLGLAVWQARKRRTFEL